MTLGQWLFFSFGMPAIIASLGWLAVLYNDRAVRKELKRQAQERGE